MKPGPHALCIELKRRFNGRNNGAIILSHRNTVGAWIEELQARGFIWMTNDPHFGLGVRMGTVAGDDAGHEACAEDLHGVAGRRASPSDAPCISFICRRLPSEKPRNRAERARFRSRPKSRRLSE